MAAKGSLPAALQQADGKRSLSQQHPRTGEPWYTKRLVIAAQKTLGIIFSVIIKGSYCCNELQTESPGQNWC